MAERLDNVGIAPTHDLFTRVRAAPNAVADLAGNRIVFVLWSDANAVVSGLEVFSTPSLGRRLAAALYAIVLQRDARIDELLLLLHLVPNALAIGMDDTA